MPAKLGLSNISKTYSSQRGTVRALDRVDLALESGSFTSIVGPSGCGKSTLFSIVAGLTPATTGRIELDGRDVTGKTGVVGYMLQKDLLLPWRSIIDNVILGLEVRGTSRTEARRLAEPVLAQYGLAGFARHFPSELSGGMRQRAALIRTLLYDRDVILLDEPFGALDAQTRVLMQEWLLDVWQGFGKTILFVTHDIDEAVFLSDRVYVMTARPGAIKAVVDVELPRPRSADQALEPEFLALKRRLMGSIRDESERAFAESRLAG